MMKRQGDHYYKLKKWLKNIILFFISILLMIFILFPFVWLILSSFKVPAELFSKPPTWLPSEGTLEYYIEIFRDSAFRMALWNSLLVSVFSTLISLLLGSLGAYAFARFEFPKKKVFFLSILCTQMLPQMALIIPLFILMRMTGLLYTYQGLILAYVTFSLPYVVWMFRAFIITVPYEIEEAARIDGCTRILALWKVVLPLAAPGLVTTGIFVFIGAWNEFLFANVMGGTNIKTIPVRIAEFIGEERIAYELMFPAGVIASLPVLILVLFFQRYIVKGLTAGSVK
ncbi:carbohydrate ABC transporter permease [Pseudoneobacillus sp. C159]